MNSGRKPGTLPGSSSASEEAILRDLPRTREGAARPSALGKYAHIPGTSDDFARRKQQEIDCEDANAG